MKLLRIILSLGLTLALLSCAKTEPRTVPEAPQALQYVSGHQPLGNELFAYQVAAQTGFDPQAFADEVSLILASNRSWGPAVRVSAGQDFTIYLVSPETTREKCGETVVVDGSVFLSCSTGAEIFINSDRWYSSSPLYPGSLTEYRQYLVNHEVGHSLGHGHEACPGAGLPASVMQQQTLGLRGCVVNSWPYGT
ncbi:DUF3152 domain-containing protein [Micromonospora orduensis]|uniref:DUF3152 domain-containing protein n=1 Tax=Micromonospora orduensis TaxID=1420891 RepID=A0A5C4QG93_9ACTN|nr:DUF3152 domain-containing protein [Micromonospora orduensis]TNH21446.1 DUF3152 domain-containing protein [Micromonospora orduensis]